jgi:hypothetical protein
LTIWTPLRNSGDSWTNSASALPDHGPGDQGGPGDPEAHRLLDEEGRLGGLQALLSSRRSKGWTPEATWPGRWTSGGTWCAFRDYVLDKQRQAIPLAQVLGYARRHVRPKTQVLLDGAPPRKRPSYRHGGNGMGEVRPLKGRHLRFITGVVTGSEAMPDDRLAGAGGRCRPPVVSIVVDAATGPGGEGAGGEGARPLPRNNLYL